MASATARASALKEALAYSEQLAREADGVLEEYTARLAALADAVAPVSEHMQELTQARGTISKAQQQTSEVMQHLDTARAEEEFVLAGPRADPDAFFASMERLDAAVRFFARYRSLQMADEVLSSAGKLRKEGLRLSADEFQNVLRRHSNAAASPAGPGPALDVDALIPGAARADLKRLGAAMLAAGDSSCLKVFAEARQKVLDRTVPVETSTSDDTSRTGAPTLDGRARVWVQSLKAAARQATAERALANAIFSPPHDAAAFGEAASRTFQSLVRTAQSVAAAPRTPEKVGCLVDMAEELEGQLPALVQALTGTATRGLWEALQGLSLSLQTEARTSMADFEALLGREGSKAIAPDGGIASSSSQALTVLRRVFGRPGAAARLVANKLSRISRQPGSVAQLNEDSAQGVLLMTSVTRILDLLKAGLTARAQGSKDQALAAIFLMNNLNFVAKSLEGSLDLGGLAADWVSINRPLVQQYADKYFRVSWQPLVDLTRDSPEGLAGDGRSLKWERERILIKDRFVRVNAEFASLHATQKSWTISDGALRDALKDRILTDVLPVYQGFFQRFRSLPFAKNPEKYLKYQSDDIKQLVLTDFFESK